MTTSTERERLDQIAADSWYPKGINREMIEYTFRIFERHIKGRSILELGPAEGVMTPNLAALTNKLTLVDGASAFCENLRQRFPQATVVQSIFEEYQPQERFDNIVLGHVLEHVDDPVQILRLAKSWLAPGGRILAAVPNARSIHRQAAVIMGLLPSEDSLNETDLHHGHRRVFNPETFRGGFLQAGLTIEIFGGYWIKPLSNQQIEASWSTETLEAFMKLGERYPDIAAEIYVIAAQKK